MVWNRKGKIRDFLFTNPYKTQMKIKEEKKRRKKEEEG
jgi:hypothetical protein